MQVFARWKDVTPNYSLRMGNVVAAMARPQIVDLPRRAAIWNDRYHALAVSLSKIPGIRLPARPPDELFVQSSIQFTVSGVDDVRFLRFLSGCRARGVLLKWFGGCEPQGYTSIAGQWRYIAAARTPNNTASIVERRCDTRIPLSLTEGDCDVICQIIAEELDETERAQQFG